LKKNIGGSADYEKKGYGSTNLHNPSHPPPPSSFRLSVIVEPARSDRKPGTGKQFPRIFFNFHHIYAMRVVTLLSAGVLDTISKNNLSGITLGKSL